MFSFKVLSLNDIWLECSLWMENIRTQSLIIIHSVKAHRFHGLRNKLIVCEEHVSRSPILWFPIVNLCVSRRIYQNFFCSWNNQVNMVVILMHAVPNSELMAIRKIMQRNRSESNPKTKCALHIVQLLRESLKYSWVWRLGRGVLLLIIHV